MLQCIIAPSQPPHPIPHPIPRSHSRSPSPSAFVHRKGTDICGLWTVQYSSVCLAVCLAVYLACTPRRWISSNSAIDTPIVRCWPGLTRNRAVIPLPLVCVPALDHRAALFLFVLFLSRCLFPSPRFIIVKKDVLEFSDKLKSNCCRSRCFRRRGSLKGHTIPCVTDCGTVCVRTWIRACV